ncbi:MAG: lysozyme inhibitor LprI family protein [Chthoniobacteraceae bacterium]
MNRTILTFALFVFAPPARSDDENKHPIDAKVAAIFDKAQSTAAMIDAADKALKLWDAELNRCYGELKKKLKPDAFAALQASQRQWLVFRDAQLKFIGEFYGQFDGTMYRPMAAHAVMEVTRTRAIELHRRLGILREHGG